MKRLRVQDHFASLQDPRVERTKRHALMDIVLIAILAVIGGADGWEDIEDFADARHEWLATFLGLRNGIPSADTFRRVFEALDAQHFQRGFASWMSELAAGTEGKLVAIDGKTARRSFARERGQGALHLVSAWVAENALALGQIATEDKSNEIVAIPQLLALLDVRGATVSIDAMGCQKKIAAAIVDKGADYVRRSRRISPRSTMTSCRSSRTPKPRAGATRLIRSTRRPTADTVASKCDACGPAVTSNGLGTRRSGRVCAASR